VYWGANKLFGGDEKGETDHDGDGVEPTESVCIVVVRVVVKVTDTQGRLKQTIHVAEVDSRVHLDDTLNIVSRSVSYRLDIAPTSDD
jgi:hypothetical protein